MNDLRPVNWNVEYYVRLCGEYVDGHDTIILYKPGVKIYDGDEFFAERESPVQLPLDQATKVALEMEADTRNKMKAIKRKVKTNG